jgi:glycosyltransferase involved in cell wall biosynthesis
LSSEYPPFIHGGVGTFVRNLAVGLSKEGVKVTVVSGYPVPSRDIKHVEIGGEKGTRLDVVRFPYLNIHPNNLIFQLLNLKKLCETIRNINPDVIHGQGLSTFPALIKLKNLAPIVVTFHTSPKVEETMSVHSFLRGGTFDDFYTYVLGYPAWSFIFRKEFCGSSMAVAVSKSLVSELLKEMGERYREKIQDIHNGIDLETLDREYNTVKDVEEADDTIVFAGRLVWRKGALNLIRLAYLLRKERTNFKLIVHGNGPLFGRIKKELRKHGLTNVQLRGFTSRAQMMRSLRRSRFVVIPSFYESCPMVLLESMCLGKIPVTFNLPYSMEFTENGKYAIMAKDLEDMVRKLRIACMASDLKSLSAKVKDFARARYNMRNVSLKYLDAYKAVST